MRRSSVFAAALLLAALLLPAAASAEDAKERTTVPEAENKGWILPSARQDEQKGWLLPGERQDEQKGWTLPESRQTNSIPHQTKRLNQSQQQLRRYERRARTDGFVSPEQRRRIGHAKGVQKRRLRSIEAQRGE